MSTRIVMALGTALCATSLVAGNVCTWKGGSGSLADDNWDVAPVSGNGDTIAFDTTDGTAITAPVRSRSGEAPRGLTSARSSCETVPRAR